ncbi:MAG: clostripain-related cysteine peptidase [Dysgonomonas sp.]|nr:clostripain-related cysteine peptidase [Dysgonomonas sp.]
MRSFYSKILFFIFLSFSLFACDKNNGGGGEPEPKLDNRTILVYMGGDNNLSLETDDKIKELAKGWSSDFDGSLLIYQDTPSKSHLIKITGFEDNKAVYDIIKDYEKSNSADPQVFRNAIDDALKSFPAKDYGMIVFSHGSGWLPPHVFYGTTESEPVTSLRSIIIDGDSEMDIKDFAEVLPVKVFSFVIFEACNMANVEVAYELKDKTKYVVGSSSPMLSPGLTYVYAKNLKYLYETEANVEAFAKSYFDLWNSYTGIQRAATISLINTSELNSLATLIRAIRANNTEGNMPEHLQIYDGTLEAPFYFFDLGQYYASLGNEQQKEELNTILSKCLVYKANTPNYANENGVFVISHHSGLTTYIEQENLQNINEEYRKLKWYRAISPN